MTEKKATSWAATRALISEQSRPRRPTPAPARQLALHRLAEALALLDGLVGRQRGLRPVKQHDQQPRHDGDHDRHGEPEQNGHGPRV